MEFVALRKVEACSLCSTKSRAHKLLDIQGALCKACYTRYRQKLVDVYVNRVSMDSLSFVPFEGSVVRKVTGFQRKVDSDVHNYSQPILMPPGDDEGATGAEPASSECSPERMRKISSAVPYFGELSPLLHVPEPPMEEKTPEQTPEPTQETNAERETPKRPNMRVIDNEMQRIQAWMDYDQDVITDQQTEVEKMAAEIASLKEQLAAVEGKLASLLKVVDDFNARVGYFHRAGKEA